jgi:hypothetical protein
MGKRGLSNGRWIFWIVALFAWFLPTQASAIETNLLSNGNFVSGQQGWSGANGGTTCSNGSPTVGGWDGLDGLFFSYVSGSVTQIVTIPTPSTLELSFLASSAWGGTYSAVLSDSNETASTGNLTAGANQVSNLSITTTNNNEPVVVTFTGRDALFWAGCYGPVIRNASLVAIAEPTSLVVTSLSDDGSSGTLRWAINQANSQSGGIYDSITLPTGVINLTSALPTITQNLTISGNGKTSTVIDGVGQYRIFNINTGVSFTVSDLTLKGGQNTNGGLIYNNRGIVTADRVRFTGMTGGSAVFNNNGGAVAYYTDSTWDYLSTGIAGDYGSTPNLAAGVTSWSGTSDTVFQNRTYVTRGTFENNTHGIYNYRFTKVIDSTFTNNSGTGANVTGLNRTQIINSVFTNNGIAIYHSAWIPVGWNMGTDNRLISGNTFTGNATAIYLDDGWNNNQRNQSWSTVSNNTWSGAGTWITYSQWNGTSNIVSAATLDTESVPFIQSSNVIPPPPTTTTTTTTAPPTTTTTTPPVCGPYQSVAVTGKTSGAVWGSGPYTDDSDLGVAAVHAGLIEVGQTATLEIYDVLYYQSFSGSTANGITTANWNSGWCGFNIRLATPPTTTTTEPTTTLPPTTTTTEPPVEEPTTTLPPDTIPSIPETTDGGPDGGTGSSTDTTSPETTVPQPAPEEETPDTTPDIPLEEETPEAVVDDILANDPSPEELADAVGDVLSATESEEELVAVAAELLTSDLDAEQFAAVVAEVFSQDLSDEALTQLVATVFAEDLSDAEIAAVVDQVFTGDISDEAFAEVLNTVFEEPLSDEAFESVIDAILDEPISDAAFDELVDVLGSDTVSDEQVVSAVDTIINNGLSDAQSVSIATSGEVLESITPDQASVIFDVLPIDEITTAEATALVEAVQTAPVAIKKSFEEEIDIFDAGNIDIYVPLGSNVPVGTRRVIIAATSVVVMAAPVPVSRKVR